MTNNELDKTKESAKELVVMMESLTEDERDDIKNYIFDWRCPICWTYLSNSHVICWSCYESGFN